MDDAPYAPLPLVYETTVAERHIDRFGHVNVMWYTHYFDEATLGLFERLGCGPSYYRASAHGMFALESHTRYLSELRLGEAVQARARLLGASARRIHFILFLAGGEDRRLSATSELVGMHVDLARRRSAPLPEVVSVAASRLVEEHRALSWAAPVCGAMRA